MKQAAIERLFSVFLVGLPFDLQNGGDVFFGNVG
jgi:hypothetical protein